MPASKRTMLEGRLRRRIRVLSINGLDEYCRYLFDKDGLDREIVQLIDAVTTNKTEFFREPAHFRFVVDQALPALTKVGRSQIKAWSAACSVGAEPYTLAMVLEEHWRGPDHDGFGLNQSKAIMIDSKELERDAGGKPLRTFPHPAPKRRDYSILCTDLCTEALDQAVAGRFQEGMIEPVDHELRRRYLMRSREPGRKLVRITPHLRSRLAFARLNLMDEDYPVECDMDLIFCRNILIYFDKPTQGKVLRRLCDHLRPGGHLFLGHSESIAGIDLPVVQAANTVFRRV